MDNSYINIRIMAWHFQVDNKWKIKFSKNNYHIENKYEDGYFKIYKFFI